jgi:CsoR family transcriptional regulator, copper-sensing transcriptional repressor
MTTISHADTTSEHSTPAAAEKKKILNRLRRLEGQVRGLHKMVDEDRDCQEILTLLASIKSALNATGDALFESYIDRCQQDEQPVKAAEILKVARLLR